MVGWGSSPGQHRMETSHFRDLYGVSIQLQKLRLASLAHLPQPRRSVPIISQSTIDYDLALSRYASDGTKLTWLQKKAEKMRGFSFLSQVLHIPKISYLLKPEGCSLQKLFRTQVIRFTSQSALHRFIHTLWMWVLPSWRSSCQTLHGVFLVTWRAGKIMNKIQKEELRL